MRNYYNMGYDIELEVFEGNCFVHKVGEKFNYPEDRGLLCPWLWDSAGTMVRILQYGGTLPWKYQNTPYEKEIDKKDPSFRSDLQLSVGIYTNWIEEE